MARNWKGNCGELQVIRLILPWWRQVEPEAVMVRSPRSGAWARSPGFKARGDVTVDPETCRLWPFSLEVKWRKVVKKSSIRNFLESKPSPIWAYWEQCRAAAEDDGLRPLLWFRGNRMGWRVVVEADRKSISGPSLELYQYEDFLKLDPRRFLSAV